MEWWIGLSEIVRNLGLILAAGVGIAIAYRRVEAATRQAESSNQQAELARRDHVAELFNRSVGQLGDDKLEVRLGAIYTLRQIANDFPDLSDPTYNLLSAHMRETAPDYEDEEPPIDVEEIIRTIKDRLSKNE